MKILDMGLARIESAEPEYDKTVTHELTQAGMVMGTVAYIAPEQALDTRKADGRSDIGNWFRPTARDRVAHQPRRISGIQQTARCRGHP